MADIAIIFHWKLSEMDDLDIIELMQWRDKAINRWNQINNPEED
ncbi:GpE family phage tail protein [Pseudoalteromonas luteoviolacea]|uniref:p2 GpE family protein n=1 Tax=Pseudoalteromonas luteoviolacea NCIMB 1942 TaxID=1365253 RepID=A0A162A4D0_9GAMM|nr:GpE family phage tail protein [Pseudoalteromonas luteoviolacea]KZN44003.1 P2 GpE family protein [Pseudoalteromonas luteoviolacea NCIMB 1942]